METKVFTEEMQSPCFKFNMSFKILRRRSFYINCEEKNLKESKLLFPVYSLDIYFQKGYFFLKQKY